MVDALSSIIHRLFVIIPPLLGVPILLPKHKQTKRIAVWQVVTLIEDERGGSQNIALADALDGRCWFPWRYWVQQQRLYGRIRFLMTWNKRWLSGARKLYHFGQWYGENLSDHHHYEIPQKYCAFKKKEKVELVVLALTYDRWLNLL